MMRSRESLDESLDEAIDRVAVTLSSPPPGRPFHFVVPPAATWGWIHAPVVAAAALTCVLILVITRPAPIEQIEPPLVSWPISIDAWLVAGVPMSAPALQARGGPPSAAQRRAGQAMTLPDFPPSPFELAGLDGPASLNVPALGLEDISLPAIEPVR